MPGLITLSRELVETLQRANYAQTRVNRSSFINLFLESFIHEVSHHADRMLLRDSIRANLTKLADSQPTESLFSKFAYKEGDRVVLDNRFVPAFTESRAFGLGLRYFMSRGVSKAELRSDNLDRVLNDREIYNLDFDHLGIPLDGRNIHSMKDWATQLGEQMDATIKEAEKIKISPDQYKAAVRKLPDYPPTIKLNDPSQHPHGNWSAFFEALEYIGSFRRQAQPRRYFIYPSPAAWFRTTFAELKNKPLDPTNAETQKKRLQYLLTAFTPEEQKFIAEELSELAWMLETSVRPK